MLEVRYVSARGLDGERSRRLLNYLLEHGADEFTVAVLALQRSHARSIADYVHGRASHVERFDGHMQSTRGQMRSLCGQMRAAAGQMC